MLNPPIDITVRYADGRTHSIVPPGYRVVDMVWDRQVVESQAVDHYARFVPGPEVALTVSLKAIEGAGNR